MKQVVTYREAYRDTPRWNLCAECATDEARRVRLATHHGVCAIGPLGPVEWGQRDGYCDLCEADEPFGEDEA